MDKIKEIIGRVFKSEQEKRLMVSARISVLRSSLTSSADMPALLRRQL